MGRIFSKNLHFDEKLKKNKVYLWFCNTTPTIINGCIRKVDKINLSYIGQHKIIIKIMCFLLLTILIFR